MAGMTNGNRVKNGRYGFTRVAPGRDRPAAGFTMIELLVSLGMLAILAGVVILNIGTFFGEDKKTKTWGVEQHQISSAVGLYMVANKASTIDAFDVGPFPLGKNVLDSYLLGELIYKWHVAANGSVSPDAAYLFSSDLNSLDSFTSLMGSWLAGDGVLSPTGSRENRLVANGGPWQDFTFQTTATLVSGNNSGYGMYYRCTSDPNITGYIFQFDPGLGNQFVVRKVVAGTEFNPFQSVSMPAGFPVNGEHNISVSVQGDHHIIKVDGAIVLDFRDSQFSSGTVGTRTWSNSNVTTQVNFTDFKVSP
jgi:prepilin-type N-terminal cleavage/methylation domain-containing protein